MADGITVTVRLVLKPELADAVSAAMPAMFEQTKTFKGFRRIKAMRHQEHPHHLLLVEDWDSEEDYRAYIAWRESRGELSNTEHLVSMDVDIWPNFVGEASA